MQLTNSAIVLESLHFNADFARSSEITGVHRSQLTSDTLGTRKAIMTKHANNNLGVTDRGLSHSTSHEVRISRRDFMRVAAASTLCATEGFALALRGGQRSFLHDLDDVSIPHLHRLYAAKKYTATEVTQWYLDRIAHFNPTYRAILHVDTAGALTTAAELDRAALRSGPDPEAAPLWGVPVVIKANTSVKGLITSVGWWGYQIPGRELIAPVDATIVRRIRAAGAIILGQSNMPDFAAGDMTISSVYGRTGNAYDPRFSPGGSSGGTATAVAANLSVWGTGTDTGNSIRMPAATSALVGVLPTRGLVSIAGIHPLNWLLDNTGPIARTVTDAAIVLGVMAGEDPADFRTAGSGTLAQPGPYTKYLNADALRGRRFGVPSFLLKATSTNAAGVNSSALQPETRERFEIALEELRRVGAIVVQDDAILPPEFQKLVAAVNTGPYRAEGTDIFLRDFGPAQYRSSLEYAKAVGAPLPPGIRGISGGGFTDAPRRLNADPQADQILWEPQRKALAMYDDALERFDLDGFVYPPLWMPPNDETLPLVDGRRSSGPHGDTGWVNVIGVPAISIPAGYYTNGIPCGIELSARRWQDGDLLGWAFAYEQATRHRKAPQLRLSGA